MAGMDPIPFRIMPMQTMTKLWTFKKLTNPPMTEMASPSTTERCLPSLFAIGQARIMPTAVGMPPIAPNNPCAVPGAMPSNTHVQ